MDGWTVRRRDRWMRKQTDILFDRNLFHFNFCFVLLDEIYQYFYTYCLDFNAKKQEEAVKMKRQNIC